MARVYTVGYWDIGISAAILKGYPILQANIWHTVKFLGIMGDNDQSP